MSTSDVFRELHRSGTFVMPNPWDAGSGRALEKLGFKALATTSSGRGRAIGKADHLVTRDELVAHVREMTAMLTVPLSVDGERLYPDDEGGITATIALFAEAGAAGCSIEDADPPNIVPLDEATAAVAEAVEACRRHGMVLTARAENHLYGVDDIEDTLTRLRAYRDAGAEVLFAPGLVDLGVIARVVREVQVPLSVLLRGEPSTIGDLAAVGVRRISTGGALQTLAYTTMRDYAKELHDAQPD